MDATLIDNCDSGSCCFFCSKEAQLTIQVRGYYYNICNKEIPQTVAFGEIFGLTSKQILAIEEFLSIKTWSDRHKA